LNSNQSAGPAEFYGLGDQNSGGINIPIDAKRSNASVKSSENMKEGG